MVYLLSRDRGRSSDGQQFHAEQRLDIPRPVFKKALVAAAALLLVLLILLPPLVRGYEVPSLGRDTIHHVNAIETGNYDDRYLGTPIVGYPMSFLSDLTGASVDGLFLWFSYLVLIAAGFSWAFVCYRLINRWAGLIVAPLFIFCTASIMVLFYSGCIFNIISVYILLPFALFFLVRSLTRRQKRYYIGLIFTLILAGAVHPTGCYLPLALIPYLIFARKWKFALLLTVVGGLYLWQFHDFMGAQHNAVPIYHFLANYIRITPLLLLVFSVGYIIKYRKSIHPTKGQKMLVRLLLSLVFCSTILSFTPIITDPGRAAIDLAAFIAVLTACLAGLVVKTDRRLALPIGVLIGLGSLPLIYIWTDYQSYMNWVL